MVSAVASSNKLHHMILSRNHPNSISKLLGFFHLIIFFGHYLNSSDCLWLELNFLLKFVVRHCLSIHFCDSAGFKLYNKLSFPLVIFIDICHHHSQPSFTGLSKPSLSGPILENQLPSVLVVLEVFSVQPILTNMPFPWANLTWTMHNMPVDLLYTDMSIFMTAGICSRIHNCLVRSWAIGSSWAPLCLVSILRFFPSFNIFRS